MEQTDRTSPEARRRAWLGCPRPGRGTLFLRTFLPWQIWRFARINWKMIRIIGRSHAQR
jgi:hypothetical protein